MFPMPSAARRSSCRSRASCCATPRATCCSTPAAIRRPPKIRSARWGGMAKIMTPIMPPGENVLTGLAGIGFSADDVDVVVCSHLHPDHCGCNAFFQRATIMVHAKDVAAAREPNAEAMGYLAAEWDFGTIDAVERAARPVRRRPDRADPAAGPYAGLDRRAGPARAQPGSCSRPTPRRCASRSTRASCRAIFATPTLR